MRLPTERSLSEQMRITPREIERRKDLFNIAAADCQCLQKLQTAIDPHLDDIIEEFYALQTRHPEISLIIGDTETLRRLKLSMRMYIRDIFSGTYDDVYVEGRLRVGKIHMRIGVTPKLYMSGMAMLQNILQDYVDMLLPGQPTAHEKKAIQKILLFDSQLVFETYIASLTTEIEAAKHEVEIYAHSLEERAAERMRQLEQLSKTDPLTGLLNQRALWEFLRREIGLVRRSQHFFSILYFDLNGFKKANDRWGHQIGDEILCAVAAAIRCTTREVDIACRYGGDEFCLIMPHLDKEDTDKVARRLIACYSKNAKHDLTFSFGTLEIKGDINIDAQEMLHIADKRMYEAKEKSRQIPGHWLNRGDKIFRIEPDAPIPFGKSKLKLV